MPNPPIKHLAVVNNEDVHMDDFQSQMVDQIRAMGIQTSVVSAPPGNADYLTYTANWRWDIGMYCDASRLLFIGPKARCAA